HPHELSADGGFSWEEVECLGACVNAPMVQIAADTYEDLTPESFEMVLDAFQNGERPAPGPQIKRTASAPVTGLTSLTGKGNGAARPKKAAAPKAAAPAKAARQKPAATPQAPAAKVPAAPADAAESLLLYASPPADGADDLKKISGVGPKLEGLLNSLGIYKYD
ncbi:MAG: NADH-quinone oxidoreductase subunit E, partial [Gammaproteobacteria bacterium]|nr:NADH-quinone oxidoreductase subunit E [Gammaproteobacteria bacterium]NIO25406.1 NADH-quinone oxidoreductase subunit E [Gammaproteobacteria bacterium]NIQ26850.1 NADH-quinone oxidoreductase subunit E [Gammaproteobacteria bacterium]NIR19904.1 NADH-quinone oxidoreductase subunit E [Gammaproteobacteria bacterium]NIT17038.1 NADH-quinone oxidoreductase subunit E [Gammaproteobacteria bacterium]